MQTIDDAAGLQDLMRELVGKSDGPDLRTGERQSHLERLVEHAIQYLKLGHEKVHSAELAKSAAEEELKRYRGLVKGQVEIKIRELEAQMQLAASQLAAAKRSAIVAEGRANKAEASVRRLEDEIRRKSGPRIVRTAA